MVHKFIGLGISSGSCNGVHRACPSSLSHSIGAGSGIESSISCVADVGGVGVDELVEEDVVDRPRLARSSLCYVGSIYHF